MEEDYPQTYCFKCSKCESEVVVRFYDDVFPTVTCICGEVNIIEPVGEFFVIDPLCNYRRTVRDIVCNGNNVGTMMATIPPAYGSLN